MPFHFATIYHICMKTSSVCFLFPSPHPLKSSPPYSFSFSHPPSPLLCYLLSALPLHPFVFCQSLSFRKSGCTHSSSTLQIVAISTKLAPRCLIPRIGESALDILSHRCLIKLRLLDISSKVNLIGTIVIIHLH